jgi:hypothetical protein
MRYFNMKHTKGPWVYSPERSTHDCCIHTKDAKEECGYISPENGGVVGSSEWTWINEADAQLIASAPRLLEVIESLLYRLDNVLVDEFNTDPIEAELDELRFAVKIARRGEYEKSNA